MSDLTIMGFIGALIGAFGGFQLALTLRALCDCGSREIAALEWFSLPNGLLGFRGILGGYPRQIVGENYKQLRTIAERMARGEA